MVNLIRRCTLMAAVASLMILAPAAYARFPVRFPVQHHEFFHPFFSPAVRSHLIRDRSDLIRDRADLIRDLRTHNPSGFIRDRNSFLRDRTDLVRELRTNNPFGSAFLRDRDRAELWRMNAYGGSGSYGGGYGGGGYGGGGYLYGSGAYGSGEDYAVTDAPAVAVLQGYATERPANFFDLLGLPNSGEHLDWPLGLRVLPPEASLLGLQIEAQLQEAANQSISGKVDPKLVAATSQATRKLRGLLADLIARDRIAPSTSAEASAFLDRLQDGLRLLQ